MDTAILKLLNANGETSHVAKGAKLTSEYQDYPIPIIYLSGSVAGMTKDESVTLDYIYREKSGTCTLKWQGASSVNCPKKNYTIKFDKEFEVVSGWGAQKKYVLKANYVDSSHARNIVCAKLWGQIVKSRTPANATLNALPNGGAIDGFPVIISLNGEFHGLYTWNIPKDGWMFGMSGTEQQQAILCAEFNNNGAVCFKGLATLTEDANGQVDFDLEYSSDDKSDWILTSLNRLIGAVMNSDGTNITYGITPYLDWESAIDYYIHSVLTGNYDGLQRNYILATYDGVKWFFSAYDMDVVLGLRAMGKYFRAASLDMKFAEIANAHNVFKLIWKYMRPQLRARYEELRAAAMSVENVANMFCDFVAEIPLPVYIDDIRLWNTVPSNSANNLSQIVTYYDLRCRNADEWIKDTSGQTALPEQVNPNVYSVTNTLEHCTTSNSAKTVAKNSAYTATISANSGYELKSVIVTMGGVNITSNAYSNGVITINSVTGDVVVTARATEIPTYTYENKVPLSIDSDKTVFNGTGYKNKSRLSSSGVVKDDAFATATGYMDVQSGDTVRIKGYRWYDTANGSLNYICVYNSSFGFVYAGNAQSAYSTATFVESMSYDEETGVSTIKIKSGIANIAYFRISVFDVVDGASSAADGANLIVTVNEEIK